MKSSDLWLEEKLSGLLFLPELQNKLNLSFN